MNNSGIGVQQILPRSGTGWQGAQPAPNRGSGSASAPSRRKPERGPAAPGTGQLIDTEA